MIDRLRGFLNRPLQDGDRPRLFAVAVAVIVAAGAGMSLLEDPEPPRRTAAPTPSSALPAAAVPLDAPSEEGKPTAATRDDVARAKRAARRFLAGYLPYAYGRSGARRIEPVGPQLRERLERERPRVPAGERRRRARVLLLQARGVSRDRAELVALVGDGARRYTVAVELAREPAGWRVIDVGG